MLQQNLRVARGFQPMSRSEMAALRLRVREQALDGRFELFKSTAFYDGSIGRKQHGFPGEDELNA